MFPLPAVNSNNTSNLREPAAEDGRTSQETPAFRLGKQEPQLRPQSPFRPEFGFFDVVEPLGLGTDRLFADAEDLAEPPPSGTVHLLPLLAS